PDPRPRGRPGGRRRHARRTRRRLRRVRRDRRIPTCPRGGRLMADTPGAPETNGDEPGENIHQSDVAVQARRMNFGPGRAVGMPVERTENFTAVLRRLGYLLGHETRLLWAVLALMAGSVALTSSGPRILGQATDVI